MIGNRQLGDFLRSRRLRLQPEDVGLPIPARRRTPGLRREEVAGLAGISTEWYVRLEQGRAVSPSSDTIAALGKALRLDRVEQDHLRRIADQGRRPPFRREDVPPILRRIVEGLSQPAYVTGQRFDVLVWNDAAAHLLTDFALLALPDRNMLLFMFGDPAARGLFGETWVGEAQRMVSLFRVTHDLWPDDPAFAELVERLHACSPDFSRWWAEHRVAAPVSGTKALQQAARGTVRFDYATFQSNDDPMLKLALYTG